MKALKWINIGAFVSMVTVNALANLIPIAGNTTGQVSEAYPNLFTPAPVTFAIWGLIYLFMLFFTIYQTGIFYDEGQSIALQERIGPWFAVSCALNILWVLLWHNRLIGLSTVCIILLLGSLILIVDRLNGMNGSLLQIISTTVGFSLYYGWIIAATIANISVFLTQIGWNGWGLSADFWTVVVLMIGAVIGSAVALIGKNMIATIAVMWAYTGILIRHISSAYYGGAHPYVIAAAVCSEALMLAAVLISVFVPKCRKKLAAYRS